MQNRDAFSSYHPLVNFLYFALVLGCTMFFMHPVSLCISLAGALSYGIYLKGWKMVRFTLFYLLPMMLMAAILNPAFNHAGVTILTYLPSGNPLTLESIAYGIGAAGMLAAVILWFSCYTEVMTSDKFGYLFGRIIPALSLILSMTLRFVPKYQAQFRVVREAQKCVGRDISDGGIISRIKHTVTIFSIMVTWALENAIETADSMKSRGYGLKGRTAFSIYRFDGRDKMVLLWLLFCSVFIAIGALCGGMAWGYFPVIQGAELIPLNVGFQLVYLALCFTPVFLDRREDRKWNCLQSEI
ncbi:energy-coupling factor transporter transmembrane component T [Anaerotignum sp.]|nr:energy-coupling factor transporter transmembrane component T [Anaerotignum sp.]MBQ7759356.1 energy-coupling factor transporter transmembrane protein EcfT [Anaerotignum sp.]